MAMGRALPLGRLATPEDIARRRRFSRLRRGRVRHRALPARQWRRVSRLKRRAARMAFQRLGKEFRNRLESMAWPRSIHSDTVHCGELCEALMEDALLRAVDNTIRFLRLAAIELRRLAERAPDISAELHHVADQLEADAADLERASGPSRNSTPAISRDSGQPPGSAGGRRRAVHASGHALEPLGKIEQTVARMGRARPPCQQSSISRRCPATPRRCAVIRHRPFLSPITGMTIIGRRS